MPTRIVHFIRLSTSLGALIEPKYKLILHYQIQWYARQRKFKGQFMTKSSCMTKKVQNVVPRWKKEEKPFDVEAFEVPVEEAVDSTDGAMAWAPDDTGGNSTNTEKYICIIQSDHQHPDPSGTLVGVGVSQSAIIPSRKR
jgi:hypothetical protein